MSGRINRTDEQGDAADVRPLLAGVLPAKWMELPMHGRTGTQVQIPRDCTRRGDGTRSGGYGQGLERHLPLQSRHREENRTRL